MELVLTENEVLLVEIFVCYNRSLYLYLQCYWFKTNENPSKKKNWMDFMMNQSQVNNRPVTVFDTTFVTFIMEC